MEFYDSHVHTEDESADRESFLNRINEAGLSRSVIISKHPAGFEDNMKLFIGITSAKIKRKPLNVAE